MHMQFTCWPKLEHWVLFIRGVLLLPNHRRLESVEAILGAPPRTDNLMQHTYTFVQHWRPQPLRLCLRFAAANDPGFGFEQFLAVFDSLAQQCFETAPVQIDFSMNSFSDVLAVNR